MCHDVWVIAPNRVMEGGVALMILCIDVKFSYADQVMCEFQHVLDDGQGQNTLLFRLHNGIQPDGWLLEQHFTDCHVAAKEGIMKRSPALRVAVIQIYVCGVSNE